MASYLQQRREEIEVALLEFELFKCRVLLGLTVLLCLSAIASTILCALHGWTWPTAGSGASVAVLGGLTAKGASSPAAPNPAEPQLKALRTLITPPYREQDDAPAGEWVEHAEPVVQKS
jgi:hypothetical protein